MAKGSEQRSVPVEELNELFCVEQVERARKMHVRLVSLAFESGLPMDIITPQLMLEFNAALLQEMIGHDIYKRELDIARSILETRIVNVTDWETATTAIAAPAAAEEVSPARAQWEADWRQQTDGGLAQFGEKIGLPPRVDPHYPVGHGDEYS